MLNTQDSKEYTRAGLCAWIRELHFNKHISLDEHNIMDLYITNNRPSKWSLDCILYPGSYFYYWKLGKKAPRIRWIKKHLKKLS